MQLIQSNCRVPAGIRIRTGAPRLVKDLFAKWSALPEPAAELHPLTMTVLPFPLDAYRGYFRCTEEQLWKRMEEQIWERVGRKKSRAVRNVELPEGLLYRTVSLPTFLHRMYMLSAAEFGQQILISLPEFSLPGYSSSDSAAGSRNTCTTSNLVRAVMDYGSASWNKLWYSADYDAQALGKLGITLDSFRILLLAIDPRGLNLSCGSDREEIIIYGFIPLDHITVVNDMPGDFFSSLLALHFAGRNAPAEMRIANEMFARMNAKDPRKEFAALCGSPASQP